MKQWRLFLGVLTSFAQVRPQVRTRGALYGAASNGEVTPTTVLIDKDGNVRWVKRKIEAFSHGPDMVRKMRELKMIAG